MVLQLSIGLNLQFSFTILSYKKKTMEPVLKYLKYLNFLDRFPDLKSFAEEIGWLLFRFWLIAAFAGNGIGCVLNRNTRILCKIIPETYGAHLSIFIEKAKAQKPKTFQYPLFHRPLYKGFGPFYISPIDYLDFCTWKILKTNKMWKHLYLI